MSRRLRRTVLTLHVVGGVGLLGVCAVIVLIHVRALTMADPTPAYELLAGTPLLGIPLSFLSLTTGIALGLSSKWGVLRYGWVTAKLVLNVSVIVVGALVLGPQTSAMVNGEGSETALVLASAYDVAALLLATGLSVFKPRAAGSRAGRARARTPATTSQPADPSRSRTPRRIPQES